jgi:hypothetical protein
MLASAAAPGNSVPGGALNLKEMDQFVIGRDALRILQSKRFFVRVESSQRVFRLDHRRCSTPDATGRHSPLCRASRWNPSGNPKWQDTQKGSPKKVENPKQRESAGNGTQ